MIFYYSYNNKKHYKLIGNVNEFQNVFALMTAVLELTKPDEPGYS